jgi:hypothetical protein
MAAQIGINSLMANVKDVKKDLTYKKEHYTRLTTKHDFVTKSSGLASIGMGNNREVILISEEDKQSVLKMWNETFAKKEANFRKAKASLSTQGYIGKVLTEISAFSHACLTASIYPNKDASQKKWLEFMIIKSLQEGDVIDIRTNGMPDMRAAIPLRKFIAQHCGVCRHIVLVNNITAASLVNTNHLPKGQVRQFRSKGHAVMAYITSGTIWVLDPNSPSPFYLVPLNQLPAHPRIHTNEARALRFKNTYGADFYTEMFKRLLPKQNAAAAANPNVNADAVNPYGNAAGAAAAAAPAQPVVLYPHAGPAKPNASHPQPKRSAQPAADNPQQPDDEEDSDDLLNNLLGPVPPQIRKWLQNIDDNVAAAAAAPAQPRVSYPHAGPAKANASQPQPKRSVQAAAGNPQQPDDEEDPDDLLSNILGPVPPQVRKWMEDMDDNVAQPGDKAGGAGGDTRILTAYNRVCNPPAHLAKLAENPAAARKKFILL